MAQYLRPNNFGGNQTGVWYGGFGKVGEAVRDDTDFINSTNNAAGDYNTVRLSSPASTPATGDMILRYTYSSSNTNSTPRAPASGGTTPVIQFEIEELVGATWTSRYTTTSLSCPTNGTWSAASDTIGFGTWGLWDLSLLRVKINFVSGGGGGPSARRGIATSWIEVEVPDPPPANVTINAPLDTVTSTSAAGSIREPYLVYSQTVDIDANGTLQNVAFNSVPSNVQYLTVLANWYTDSKFSNATEADNHLGYGANSWSNGTVSATPFFAWYQWQEGTGNVRAELHEVVWTANKIGEAIPTGNCTLTVTPLNTGGKIKLTVLGYFSEPQASGSGGVRRGATNGSNGTFSASSGGTTGVSSSNDITSVTIGNKQDGALYPNSEKVTFFQNILAGASYVFNKTSVSTPNNGSAGVLFSRYRNLPYRNSGFGIRITSPYDVDHTFSTIFCVLEAVPGGLSRILDKDLDTVTTSAPTATVTSGTSLQVTPANLTFDTSANIPLRRNFKLRVDMELMQFKAAPDYSFKLNSAITVAAQSAAFTGNDVQLLIAVSYTLAVDSSALTFAPSTVGFTEAAYLPVQSTSVAFSVQDIGLNSSIQVDNAFALFSGQDVQLLVTARIPVDTAAISFTPQNITSNNSLVITSNALLFSPQNVTLSLSTGQSFTLAVNKASLILSTQELGMLLGVTGGGTIDGLPSAVINTNNDSLTLYGRGGNYYSIDYGITKLQ